MAAPDPGRLLLVTLMDPDAPPGGRELLSRVNATALSTLFGDALTVHHLTRKPPLGAADALRGPLNGLGRDEIVRIVARIGATTAWQVFVDGSTLGHVVAPIKRAHPHVRVVTFFHNVEARFFLAAARAKRTPLSLALLAASWAAERAAVRHSDAIICLSDRDAAGLRRLYGRGADHVSPIALADALPSPRPPPPGGERHLLFVGGAFYANRRGIEWFARAVAPHAPLPVTIVGQGMEALRPVLGEAPRLRIVGAADDLAPFYAGALCAVAPVFEGSGMKTKVAEALMFGKRVIGTREAFSGYVAEVAAAGWQAEDAATFLDAIRTAMAAGLPAFDPAMRRLYETHYALPAATRRLAAIMLPRGHRP